jgi:aryl-alcohol dehydrogenase-like predicted oxidoreductase
MRYRQLGQSGIEASVVGFGAWAIGGHNWGGTDEVAAVAAIRTALDEGITLLDTAPVYGFGVSEETCGKAIEGRRDEVVLATKCGLVWHTQRGDHFFDGPVGPVYRYLGRDAIRHEVEESLRRLRTDRLDLLQTHWQETTTRREETMEALLELKAEGKIRAIGVSNCDIQQLDEYRSVGPLDVDQERYSLLDRKFERNGQLAYCREHNVAVLAYSPLEQGLLTGKVGPDRVFPEGDMRRDRPRFSSENRQRILALLADVKSLADAHGLTYGQLAIAWTVAQPGVTHALVGARNPEQARENAGAGDVVLSAEELGAIDAAVARHAPE